MQTERAKIHVHVDRYTRVCLTLIVVLLTVLIVGLWADGVKTSDRAVAAEPFLNTSMQREKLLANTATTNEKLDELMKLLKSGDVKVQVAEQVKPKIAGDKRVGK